MKSFVLFSLLLVLGATRMCCPGRCHFVVLHEKTNTPSQMSTKMERKTTPTPTSNSFTSLPTSTASVTTSTGKESSKRDATTRSLDPTTESYTGTSSSPGSITEKNTVDTTKKMPASTTFPTPTSIFPSTTEAVPILHIVKKMDTTTTPTAVLESEVKVSKVLPPTTESEITSSVPTEAVGIQVLSGKGTTVVVPATPKTPPPIKNANSYRLFIIIFFVLAVLIITLTFTKKCKVLDHENPIPIQMNPILRYV